MYIADSESAGMSNKIKQEWDGAVRYLLDDTPQTGFVFGPGRHLVRAEGEWGSTSSWEVKNAVSVQCGIQNTK
jgi:hypothetical protein